MVDRGHRVESDLFSCLTCRKVGGRRKFDVLHGSGCRQFNLQVIL